MCMACRASNDSRLGAFQIWVASNGAGMQLECAIRLNKSKELQEQDAGTYLDWGAILLKHHNNVPNAAAFIHRRRSEAKGTGPAAIGVSFSCVMWTLCAVVIGWHFYRSQDKQDLNDPTIEKFLWFDDSTFKSTTTTLVPRFQSRCQQWM